MYNRNPLAMPRKPISRGGQHFYSIHGYRAHAATSSECQNAEVAAFSWTGERAQDHLALTPSLASCIPKKLGPFTLRVKLGI